ncbi:MAG: nitroreductase [Bacteroidetes bacterium]|nr:MAG: nitroreductase [Bacteroidota bacterium]
MKFNLSEVTDLIRSRRTVYPENYSERQIQRDQLEQILNNALWAPTHGNTQPWRFVVFQGDSREELADFLAKTYLKITPKEQQKDSKLAKMLNRPKQAPVVVAVCMKRDPNRKIREIEEIEAVACAIHNMHLTCTAYGIGGFWSTPGPIYSEDVLPFLGLEEEDRCLGLFYMGYPKSEWPDGQRKPLEYLTEWKN